LINSYHNGYFHYNFCHPVTSMVCICIPASQGHGIVVHNHLSRPILYVTRPSASVPKTINDLMLVALSAHVTIYLLTSKPMMITSHTFR